MLRLPKILLLLLALLFFYSFNAKAADAVKDFDQTSLVSQQVEVLKNRVTQAQEGLAILQKESDNFAQELTVNRVNKERLNQTILDIAIAQSNIDSLTIELNESQRSTTRLEKDIQETKNELNVFNIFGLKIYNKGGPNLKQLNTDLDSQKELLSLEKIRTTYLQKLQAIALSKLQLSNTKNAKIETLLKSQSLVQLKDQQLKSQKGFEDEQKTWLNKLNVLHVELNSLQNAKEFDRGRYDQLQDQMFYVNENINFTYLQMLFAHYEDQLQQLKISISRSSSINLLNQSNEQLQILGRQLSRVNKLLVTRVEILAKRKNISSPMAISSEEFTNLQARYETLIKNVLSLTQQMVAFRSVLDQALQQALSSRQGLPGFGVKAWLDLGSELLVVPSLIFQIVKNLSFALDKAMQEMTFLSWLGLFLLETIWVGLFVGFNYILTRMLAKMPDHEQGHINLKWLATKLVHCVLLDVATIANLLWLFLLGGILIDNFNFLLNIGIIWLSIKLIITILRLCLVETVHDTAGHEVHLFYRFRWLFVVTGVITTITSLVHQLPFIYEVKDLCDRLLLLSLLVLSIFMLHQWRLMPGFILPHIDERRTYLKKVVLLLGLLIPVILLINSIIGLFGFVNLILTISWYQSVFILVLVAYLVIRGLLNEGMDLTSKVLIRHVTNGWLWTEAFLKPLDKMLRIMLFLAAWAMLFLFYGWDPQSPVVERLNKLFNYRIIDISDKSITPISIIEIAVIISLLYWTARWTREFVYRLLLSRTSDLGLRNSIAILSQYTVIVIGIFVGLRLLGIDFRSLAFVATAFVFSAGLGLRDLVNNFVCGFLLLIERPVRVGDIVTIGGYEGEVTHIGGRAVTVRAWDHTEVLVPNAEIFSKSFTNWTAKDNVIRSSITIKANCQDSPHDVQALILQALQQHKEILADPQPEVYLKELIDGTSEFEARYYINLRLVKSRTGVKSEVLMNIWETFEKHGIQPCYPHHNVYFKSSLPLLPLRGPNGVDG
jgi:potassium efflux system protein